MKSRVVVGMLVWLVATNLMGWTVQAQPQAPAEAEATAALPLSKIVLYTSGVGYFQRDGQMTGHRQIPLRVKVQDVNDLLKSLVVQDQDGGQVAAVTYDSRDPITKALKSFAIDLTANPSLGQLLLQLRGERLEVGTPKAVRGIIVGVETKREHVDDDVVVETEYLNVFTDDGFRSLPMNQVLRLQLMNDRLNAELQQALAVLASGHDSQKKTVILDFNGTGRRRVRVAYITAVPVWKTTYRLLLSETEPPFLQGWAIVENTTDEDWQDVRLSLVSGRPVSFVMDMYTPLHVERPVVVPELYASLRPQAYGQGLDTEADMIQGRRAQAAKPSRGPAAARERRMMKQRAGVAAAPPPMSLDEPQAPRENLALQQGVVTAARAAELGELFEYTITAPVSLARQKSAMLPIVNETVAGSKVSIYNEQVHAKYPLSGFRVRNATALYLMQGPVTVFDAGAYAGDARLADLAPGQERLLSYAMDLQVEVEPVVAAAQRELVSVSLRKGVLVATRRAMAEKTYTVRNRGRQAKVVII